MKVILFARILGGTRLCKISQESGLLPNFGRLPKIRNARFGHCHLLGGLGGGGRMGWTGRPGADVPADWADRLGRGRLGQPASSRLRAEGIRDMLSSNADCGVIWLHIPGIHIKFFRAHIVIIFLGTNTLKVQRTSPGDKYFGLLEALNITYSMFIQMGHAIRDVVIVTYKGGLLSLVPPLLLCTSCCS